MQTLAITFLFSGITLYLACLPLIFRKIPMNKLYGMRTKHSFRSDEAWYHLNQIGGIIFSMLAFPLILAGIIGFVLPEHLLPYFSLTVLAVTFLSIGTALFLFMKYATDYTKKMNTETP